MVCMITLCDISMPFRSLHHPLPINGRHCSYIHVRRPLGREIANTLPPGKKLQERGGGETISTSITVDYDWTPPSKGPRAQASPSSLRNPTPRVGKKGKDSRTGRSLRRNLSPRAVRFTTSW